MIVVNGETDDHLELLQGGVIRQLLDEKWKTFVRVCMLCIFSIIAATQKCNKLARKGKSALHIDQHYKFLF